MNADLDLIKRFTLGAAEITVNNGMIEFNRMTAEQRKVLESNQDFTVKAAASSGIRFEFITDAEGLRLAGKFSAGSSRKYAFFDITVNGVLTAHEGSDDFTVKPEFDFTIALNGAMNRIAIYFPCLTKTALTDVEFIGGTIIEPVEKSLTMICYGDSITQGYDAVYPSFAYTNLLADALDAEIFNKAIGGEIFNPQFAAAPDPVQPDLITVAYGTNDWRKGETAESLARNAGDFLNGVIRNYPGVPLVAILPIWRKDMNDIHPAGNLNSATAVLKEVYAGFDNVEVVEGMTLVPHLPEFFADGYLHPNDSGFLLYGHNLLNQAAFDKFRKQA